MRNKRTTRIDLAGPAAAARLLVLPAGIRTAEDLAEMRRFLADISRRAGPAGVAVISDAGFLAAIYRDVLDRTYDQVGFAGHTEAMDARASRLDVARAVVFSLEAHWLAVEGLYAYLLGRRRASSWS